MTEVTLKKPDNSAGRYPIPFGIKPFIFNKYTIKLRVKEDIGLYIKRNMIEMPSDNKLDFIKTRKGYIIILGLIDSKYISEFEIVMQRSKANRLLCEYEIMCDKIKQDSDYLNSYKINET